MSKKTQEEMLKMLEFLPGFESMKMIEKMINEGLRITAQLLLDDLVDNYEGGTNAFKCAVDSEGVAAVCLASMLETLLKHKAIIEKMQKSGVPLQDKKTHLQMVRKDAN